MKDIVNDWPVKGTEAEGKSKREDFDDVCDEETNDGRLRDDSEVAAITDDSKEKIFGGYQSTRISFPSHLTVVRKVTLGHKAEVQAKMICGGTIIGRNLAVTAIHCFQNSNITDINFLPTNNHDVIDQFINNIDRHDFPSAKIVCYRNMTGSSSPSACLARHAEEYSQPSLHLVGMGQGTDIKFRPIARDLPLKGFDNSTCEPLRPKRRDSEIERDYFCSYGEKFGKSCFGDSGSGIHFSDPEKKLTLAGVHSSGIAQCGHFIDDRNFMVHSNVGYYVESAILDTLIGCVNGEKDRECVCVTGFLSGYDLFK